MPWGALIGLGGSLLGLAKGSPKPSAEERALSQAQAEQTKYLTNKGKNLDAIGIPGIYESLAFYRALAKGDPDTLKRYYGPAIRRLQDNYSGATDSIYQNYSRGGAQDLALAESRYRQGSDVGTLLAGAPGDAYGAITNISSSLLGQGGAAIDSSVRGTSDLLTYHRDLRTFQENQIQQLLSGAVTYGSQLFDYFKGKKTGG